jgi:hypothetical protein
VHVQPSIFRTSKNAWWDEKAEGYCHNKIDRAVIGPRGLDEYSALELSSFSALS